MALTKDTSAVIENEINRSEHLRSNLLAGILAEAGIFNSWTDIARLAAGEEYYVGLKSDGTVAAAGNNIFGQCDVAEWEQIVFAAARNDFTIGVNDGTVVATGYNIDTRCAGIENCIEYAFPAVSYIGKRTDITGRFTFGRPEHVIGDSHIYDEAENYFQTVSRAVSNLAGTEYEYNNEKFIGTDGLILGLDKMSDLYRMYKGEIAVEGYTYYVAAPPSEAQLSWTENAYDYDIAIEWFKTSAEILE